MFKIILALLFAVTYCTITNGWVMQAKYYNPAFPGKCYVSEHLILSPGQEAKMPDICAVVHCNNGNGGAQVKGCGSIMQPENCRWDGPEDKNADYPLCCVQKFVCDDPADVPKAKELQNHVREMFKRQYDNKENE